MDAAFPLVRWREIVAVGLMVVLCDLTMYRGTGFAGYALLFALAPVLLVVAAPRLRGNVAMAAIGGMAALLAIRLVWCGSALQTVIGFALLVAFAVSLTGMKPYVLETVVFGAQSLIAGFEGARSYGRFLTQRSPAVGRVPWLSVVLPAAAFLLFGMIFVLANPDLATSLGRGAERFFTHFRGWLTRYVPTPLEMLFWAAVAWITMGLLRPVIDESLLRMPGEDEAPEDEISKPAAAPLYAAFRNTLGTVIALFAVYLVFEFRTLWFREFPPGFYYSGYAHEGAAWLTAALALATVLLSLVFRGAILHDRRLPRLQRLAWLWSLENLLLAAAVYNRLFIYIGFNGMTRMRMVGLFGISTVVVGFLLVLWMIARRRGFLWLFRRHLWTLAAAVYLFALTPVDALVHRYNVRRILGGDPAPSVQVSVHPIDSEGLLVLSPLLECDDSRIRDGVRAMFAHRHEKLEQTVSRHARQGWTSYQAADRLALEELRRTRNKWRRYADASARDEALAKFHDYAYQWY
jgi:hypothetical protein